MTPSPSPTVIVLNGGSGIVQWLSFAVAALAFLVAALTLILSNLKRANIAVEVQSGLPLTIDASGGMDIKGQFWPTDARIGLNLVAYNTGGRTGILTVIELNSFDEHPSKPPL